MEKINPETSQKFLNEIRNQEPGIIEIEGIKIKTQKDVFPPRSLFSSSSEKLHTVLGDLRGKRVLDIGTGTGIQAIHAAASGAVEVTATDINPAAVACAQENIDLNDVSDRVTVISSDLFDSLEKGKMYDIVIANLPIVDYPLDGIVELALYDPGYAIHEKFFEDVSKYLSFEGVIIMSHADFNGQQSFEEFEWYLKDHGYGAETYIETEAWGHRFRTYRIKPITK